MVSFKTYNHQFQSWLTVLLPWFFKITPSLRSCFSVLLLISLPSWLTAGALASHFIGELRAMRETLFLSWKFAYPITAWAFCSPCCPPRWARCSCERRAPSFVFWNSSPLIFFSGCLPLHSVCSTLSIFHFPLTNFRQRKIRLCYQANQPAEACRLLSFSSCARRGSPGGGDGPQLCC